MSIDEIVKRANTDGWIAHHRARYLVDGEAAHIWDSTEVGGPGPVPTLLLTTVGRRSGNVSTMPLIYGRVADDYVVIASKGGADRHPGWYHNLRAQATVTVQVANRVFDAEAFVLTGEQRTAAWDEMRTIYPPYDDYQARTAREIPVVALTPTA